MVTEPTVIDTYWDTIKGATRDTYVAKLKENFSMSGICETKEQEIKCHELIDEYCKGNPVAYLCGQLTPLPLQGNRKSFRLLTKLVKVFG